MNINLLILSISLGIVASLSIYLCIHKLAPLIGGLETERIDLRYITVIAAVVIFAGTLYIFRNIVPALVASIIIVILPSQIYYWRQVKIRDITLEQLAMATQLFANEYELTRSIPKSLGVVGKTVPDPVGKVFSRAHSEMALGVPHKQVFDNMTKRINTTYGIIFVQLVKAMHNQGSVILPMVESLVGKIRVAQEQESVRKAEVTGDRTLNAIILFLPIPLFFLVRTPEINVGMFLTETTIGRIVFTLWLVSIVVWFLIDRIIMSEDRG